MNRIVDRSAQVERSVMPRFGIGVGPRQRHQVFNQCRCSDQLCMDLRHARPPFSIRTRLPKQHLRGRSHECDRRPKFVRRVGGELPSSPKGRVESMQHLIECRGQPLELVAGTKRGYAFGQGCERGWREPQTSARPREPALVD